MDGQRVPITGLSGIHSSAIAAGIFTMLAEPFSNRPPLAIP
jgi:hypothetical protein